MLCIGVATSLSQQEMASNGPTAVQRDISQIGVEDILNLERISKRQNSSEGTSTSQTGQGNVWFQLRPCTFPSFYQYLLKLSKHEDMICLVIAIITYCKSVILLYLWVSSRELCKVLPSQKMTHCTQLFSFRLENFLRCNYCWAVMLSNQWSLLSSTRVFSELPSSIDIAG